MTSLAANSEVTRPIGPPAFVVLSLLASLIAFNGALAELVRRWSTQEEYSHGFVIPLLVLWMLWHRRDVLVANLNNPSWSGPIVILLAGAIHVVGELSAFFLLSHLSYLLVLMGIALGLGGLRLLRVTAVPILFLGFAIPLPYFLDAILSHRLQLISSSLGVAFIRLFQIPVHLQGNVIDLGTYKLQVADACSGLRYLYPLLSLSFLAAYMFQAPIWQRGVVFFSAIPITVGMNSVRIGIIGVLVDRWGIHMAEGALHLFEGWVIFVACGSLLALQMYLMARFISGKRLLDVFYFPKPTLTGEQLGKPRHAIMIPATILCSLGTIAALIISLEQRPEILPERARFVAFPKQLGSWLGRPSLLEPRIEHALGLDDYVLSDYRNSDGNEVNLYVAYYPSQRKGSSPHSPIVCIPGGGWQITNFERKQYTNNFSSTSVPLNRVLIERGAHKQIVYYWFVQRGKKVANEYWSKWYLLTDAITMNRTDGALVRLTTPVYANELEQDADTRLQSFLEDVDPALRAYLPSEGNQRLDAVANVDRRS